MTNETTLLALLESKEAEANAKAEFIAEWTEANFPRLLAGEMDTDVLTLLCEVNAERAAQLNQAFYLLMVFGDWGTLILQILQLMAKALDELAETAWSDHLAELQDAMSAEQWEQYQHRSAA